MDESLKNQAINAIEDIYLKGLKNKYTGFLGVTCHDLLEHLTDKYEKTTTSDIKANN